MGFIKHELRLPKFVTSVEARWRFRLAACALIVVAAASLAYFRPHKSIPATLHGAAAIDQLKRDGQYDSLQTAMNAARLSVNYVAQSPLGRAAWHAPNAAAGYDAYVNETGVSLKLKDDAQVSLQLRSLGYGDALQPVAPGTVNGDKQSITIERAGLREWFINGANGLEHGFTIAQSPISKLQSPSPLRLAQQVGAGWRATAHADGQSVSLRNGKDQTVEYGKLAVSDARGRNIPAKLTVHDEQIVIEVEDRDARYPLTIDPLFTLQKQLLANDGADFDLFGYAVALDGNTAIIGAPYDEVTHTDQGSVYVFVRSGTNWTLQQKLFAGDGQPGDKFGSAVALSGDTALIGAPESDEGANTEIGSAYVFVRSGTTWSFQQKLGASGGMAGALFGAAVALDGNTALVGAHEQTISPSFATTGAAYVFVRNGAHPNVTWTQQQRLLANDAVDGNRFGFSVALDGDTALIGAPNVTITAATQGAAYVFTRGGTMWTQQPRLNLSSSQARTGDQFGNAVTLSGDYAAIGIHLRGSDDSGAAALIRRDATGWTLAQLFTAPNPAAGAHFGAALAMDGGLLVVGASLGLNATGVDQRTAYVYSLAGDTAFVRQLGVEVGNADDRFGYAVAVDGDTALIGAYRADAAATDQGAAYTFTLRDSQHLQQPKLIANDGGAQDRFGSAVAVSGDTVAVSAPQDTIGANLNQGSVYVFVRNGAGWVFQQKLTAGDGAANDRFGHAVAIEGDTLAAGAYADDGRGSVYVFTRNGAVWAQQPKLTAAVSSAGNFGWAVALNGNTLAVGAQGDESTRGSAFIYARNGAAWTFQQKLFANDRLPGDYFGHAIALSGGTVAVGAYQADIGANADQGAAYVFVRNGTVWTQQQKLFAATGVTRDYFATAVALHGDTLVAGAPAATTEGNFAQRPGAAYVFVRVGTGWTQWQRLTPQDSRVNDSFGTAAALSGDTLAVGGWGGVDSPYQGKAYIFSRVGEWLQQQKLTPSNRGLNDYLGWSVAVSGDTVVVGAPQDSIGTNNNQGAAYTFVAPACPALTLNPVSLPNGAVGTAYNQTLSVSGGRAGENFLYMLSGGALPPGLVYDDGLIGTPTTPGTYRFTITARARPSLCPAVRSYTLTITPPCSPVTLNPASLPSAPVGMLYSQMLTAAGGTAPYSFSVNPGSGLPAGLTLTSAGVLGGTPIGNGGAGFNITLRATDANGCTGTRTYLLMITCPTITIMPPMLPDAIIGVPYSQQLTATGGVPPYRFATYFDVLPDGLTISETGLLSGTPTTPGTAGINLQVRDANDCSVVPSYTLRINCPTLMLDPINLPNATVGTPYQKTLTVTGGTAPYHFAIIGTLPNGLSLAGGALTGTPTVFGDFNFTITATDSGGCIVGRAYSLHINAPCAAITVNPTTLPNGTVGTAYNQTATATGGTAPYTFSISAGSLPGGVNLAAGGALTGAANAAGVFNFTVTATDANGCMGTRAYTVTINSIVVNNGLQFYPLPRPLRLLDTRAGQLGCDAPGAQIQGNTSRTQLARRTCDGITIPADAKAVTGNITTVQSGGGFLTLYPSDAVQPLVANSNFAPNEVINNVFTVGLGNADGSFKIFVTSNTDVVVDITGYYAPPAAGGLYFHPLPKPIRLLETRAGLSGAFTPGTKLQANVDTPQQGRVTYDGVTIPASALAIVGNATTLNGGGGFITLYPGGVARPLAANSNFAAGQVMNAPFTVGLSATGEFNIFTITNLDMVVDVLGYYSTEANDANGAGLLFTSLLSPVRLLETRAGLTGCYTPGALLLAGSTRQQQARGACGGQTIAASALAIVGNATVVNNQAGFLTFWPNGAAQPLVASSNFAAGQVLNRHFTVGLGANGMFNIFTLTQTDLIVDVSGFFAP